MVSIFDFLIEYLEFIVILSGAIFATAKWGRRAWLRSPFVTFREEVKSLNAKVEILNERVETLTENMHAPNNCPLNSVLTTRVVKLESHVEDKIDEVKNEYKDNHNELKMLIEHEFRRLHERFDLKPKN
jgi:hypothetical protein